MDKFVVRTRRDPKPDPKSKPRTKRKVQATIESLRGVVVIEDIHRMKTVLKADNQTTPILMETLTELNKKIPSRDVLKSTRIGHTVNRLTKHSDSEVAQLATRIVKTWKKHFQDKLDKPLLEVKCDHKTEAMRKAGRKLIASALTTNEGNTLPTQIEQETFHQHGRLISAPYRRTMRKLVFTLKHQEAVRERVIKGEQSVKDLVTVYKQEAKTSL